MKNNKLRRATPPAGVALRVIGGDVQDQDGFFARRYDATPGAAYLFRPDQYLCARFRRPEPGRLAAALDRALGKTP